MNAKKIAQQNQVISAKTQTQFHFDRLKWMTVVLLLLLGIGVNYYYSSVAWAIRASVGIVVFCVLLAIISQTAKGVMAWGFIKAARAELKKVIWPNRQTTVKTTFLVIGIVLLAGVLLWGVDSFFIWVITRIMGA